MGRTRNWFKSYAEAAAARKSRNEALGHVLAKVVVKAGKKTVEKYFLGKKDHLESQKKSFESVKIY